MRSGATARAVGSMLLLKESGHLVQQLQAAGIASFLMKGALWATLYYDDIGLREFGDIDLFVDQPDMARSVIAMEKAGYVADRYRAYLLDDPARREMYFATDYQLPLVPIASQSIKSVELQWRVAYPRFSFALDWAELMDRPDELSLGGVAMRVPRSENQLLLMIIHHVGIEELDKLKYGVDLMMLLRKVGTRLDWDYVFSKAEEKGFRRMVTMGLQVVQKLDAEITFPKSVQIMLAASDNGRFITNALSHWEHTRPKPRTKSWQIVRHQLKYRDRWLDRGNMLRAHLDYFTKIGLLYHKARWYLQ